MVIKMKTVLCFGDSNTYGLNPKDKSRFDYNTRWSGLLDAKLRTHGYMVAEEGLCGRTTVFDDVLRDNRKGTDVLPFILESHSPVEYVIIMLGTNDCKTHNKATAYTISEGIRRLIKQVKNAGNAKILVISPIHLADGVGDEGYDREFDSNSVEVSRQLKKAYSIVAEQENCLFLAASDYAQPSVYDREHLDEKGHLSLANAIVQCLENDI